MLLKQLHQSVLSNVAKRILKSFIVSILQTILYYIVFYIGWHGGRIVHTPREMSVSEAIGFGMVIHTSALFFLAAITVLNVIDAIINERKWTWILLTSLAISVVIYFGHDFDHVPYKTILLVVMGLTAIYSRFWITKALGHLW